MHLKAFQAAITEVSGEPGLVDRVLALHAGSRGFDSHRGHMSERFFRSNRPGYPHPVSSELENSGIRVAVGDCSVTERRRWRPPYQTGKTVHMHAKTLQTQRGRTHGAGCVRQWFRTAEPLGERRYENWNTHRHITAVICKYEIGPKCFHRILVTRIFYNLFTRQKGEKPPLP